MMILHRLMYQVNIRLDILYGRIELSWAGRKVMGCACRCLMREEGRKGGGVDGG